MLLKYYVCTLYKLILLLTKLSDEMGQGGLHWNKKKKKRICQS